MLMKKLIMALAVAFSVMAANAKTLVVYYSFTNNVHTIVSDLHARCFETKLLDWCRSRDTSGSDGR